MRQAERDEAEGWAARERVGRGWTEREVWAEPVWRGLGRAERGWAWAAVELKADFFFGFSFLFPILLLSKSNSNKV